MTPNAANPQTAFDALRRLRTEKTQSEQCDLCRKPVGVVHDHLYDSLRGQLLCACGECAVASTEHRLVPKRIAAIAPFDITDDEWDDLRIPIGLAFFVRMERDRRIVAIYPSPAGPVESFPDQETWREIELRNDALRRMQSEVEALLINRSSGECFLLPVDQCYRLIGLIRINWRGLSGGAEVWREIGAFFKELRSRAEALDV